MKFDASTPLYLHGEPQVHVFPDKDAWTQAVAYSIAMRAARRLEKAPRFSLALTGGSTPRDVYHLLGQEPLRSQLDWSRVQIFFGDERSVGPEHPDSNYRMAREAWLGAGPIPESNIHRMEGEASDLDAAARRYEANLRELIPTHAQTGAMPSIDLILLGMGDDGHCASLFPGTAALSETGRAVVANNVPQQKTQRLTLTFPAIDAAKEVWFLVAGAGKASRVAEVLSTPAATPQAERLPSARIKPTRGELHWWLDAPAAAQLPPELVTRS